SSQSTLNYFFALLTLPNFTTHFLTLFLFVSLVTILIIEISITILAVHPPHISVLIVLYINVPFTVANTTRTLTQIALVRVINFLLVYMAKILHTVQSFHTGNYIKVVPVL